MDYYPHFHWFICAEIKQIFCFLFKIADRYIFNRNHKSTIEFVVNNQFPDSNLILALAVLMAFLLWPVTIVSYNNPLYYYCWMLTCRKQTCCSHRLYKLNLSKAVLGFYSQMFCNCLNFQLLQHHQLDGRPEKPVQNSWSARKRRQLHLYWQWN